MKLLLTSDLHIHTHFNDPIFIDIGINYLEHLKKYCKKNNISNILILGDLFHISNKIDIEVFLPIFDKIKEIKDSNIKISMIPGNHELLSKNKKTILNTFDVFSRIFNEYNYEDIEGNRLHYLPFSREIDLSKIKLNGNDILFTHIDISGFKMTEYVESKGMKQELFNSFKYVFSGHFHLFQQKKNIIYIGSPYQQNFSETGQKKGFIIYDIEKEQWEREIYNEAPEFKVFTPEQSLKEDVSNSFIKIKINKKIDNLSKLREILHDKGALNIIQEFEIEQNNQLIQEIKITENNTLQNMLKDYISNSELKLNKKKLLKYLENLIEI